MATDNTTKQYIKQQVSANLNIRDVTPQSKINQLVDGILNEVDNYENYADTKLNNMFIQTCNSEFLDKAGAQEGIARDRLPSFRFSKDTGIITINRVTASSSSIVISKGTNVQLTDTVWVIFLEDVDLATISEQEVAVGADLLVGVTGNGLDTLSIIKDSSYPLTETGYYINIKTELNIPVVEESLDEFRARVAYSKFISKFGSESAIRLAIASSSFITDYHIDYSTTPYTVYLFSGNMLYTNEYSSYINQYAIPIIDSQLLVRKSGGTSYQLKLPKKVGFNIVLKKLNPNAEEVPTILFSFSNYIERTYNVGTKITYDTDSLKAFLIANNVNPKFLNDYSVTFNRTFINFTYSTEENNVTIFEDEYPFLESITLE